MKKNVIWLSDKAGPKYSLLPYGMKGLYTVGVNTTWIFYQQQELNPHTNTTTQWDMSRLSFTPVRSEVAIVYQRIFRCNTHTAAEEVEFFSWALMLKIFFWFSWHLLLLKDHWMDNFEIRTDKTLKNKIKFFKGKRTFFTTTQNEIWVMGPYRKGNLIWHSFALGSRSSNVESAGPGLLLPSKAMILQTPGARFGGLSIAMENGATFKTHMTFMYTARWIGILIMPH